VAKQRKEDEMSAGEEQEEFGKPTEQRGGSAPGEQEVREKGEWARTAAEGVVPAELGGSDAQADLQAEDPELGSESLGRTARSEEPATEAGVDPAAGDNADATAQGGPDRKRAGEPDLKDASTGPRQVDVESGE
jgi:hypothetical protein